MRIKKKKTNEELFFFFLYRRINFNDDFFIINSGPQNLLSLSKLYIDSFASYRILPIKYIYTQAYTLTW